MIINIGRLQIRFYASIMEERIGICSQQDSDRNNHILLWDFDRHTISRIIKSLKLIQAKYHLPRIIIVQSSIKGSYHAYCFTSKSFREVINILSDTPEIDITYLRLGMVRGYYTLRITSRRNDSFKLISILRSEYPDEVELDDITMNKYLTNNKGGKNAKR